MQVKDTSNHPKENTAPTFGMSNMKQGNDTVNVEMGTRPVFKSKTYECDTMDHDGKDAVLESPDGEYC